MGGIAFKDKVRKVTPSDIQVTIDWLKAKYRKNIIMPSDYKLLGSGLDAELSGDIDLNIDAALYDVQSVAIQLEHLLGPENVKARPGTNQIFSCVPIGGDPRNGHVQVDWMFGKPEWQSWSYFSPGIRSSYKGLFRTELIKALVAFRSDWTLFENGELVARAGPTFFHDRGLVWRHRHKRMRKDGTGRLKTFSEVTREEFMQLYPDATPCSHHVEDNVNFVILYLFEGKYTKHDLKSVVGQSGFLTMAKAHFRKYEDLVRFIPTYFSVEEFGTIMEIYQERLNSLKVQIPRTIQDEITTAIGKRDQVRADRLSADQ